ncbi:hypothetical protein Mal64_25960 [Pseudobythopirellula maris]|uniref:Uncharacterized protein n=1 Tax=Pseudobythopirellula maris TaxID=2527991 RepID=A0A5C5ZNL3_9BACT|nr:hypothetical protein [Pseudobythopirellula maris]TWT89104.1 hypothetical protein Mal64_25960 [Pseudobythopirellula maris]
MAEAPAPPPADAERRKRVGRYVLRALAMNPMQESEAIVAARRTALQIETPRGAQQAALAPNRPAEAPDRERLLKELAELRKACWKAPPEEILKRVEKLSWVATPEIRTAADRIATVAHNRSRLPALAGNPDFDGDFFSALKKVLAGSPRETTEVREQIVASLRDKKLRKRAHRMIRLLQKETPGLYALETVWFDTLLRQKSSGWNRASPGDTAASISQPQASGDWSFGWGGGWFWWIIAATVIRVIIRTTGNSGD